MSPDCLPPVAISDPNVGQHDAVLDDSPKIFKPPTGLDGSDHHVLGNGSVEDLYLDRIDRLLKRRLEPQLEEVTEELPRPGAVAAE